jgi:hypothetical protein
VLTTLEIVRIDVRATPNPGVETLETEVVLVHCTVARMVEPSMTEGVISVPPKFMPSIVTSLAPEVGELTKLMEVIVGLSKENQSDAAVPASKLMVTPIAL